MNEKQLHPEEIEMIFPYKVNEVHTFLDGRVLHDTACGHYIRFKKTKPDVLEMTLGSNHSRFAERAYTFYTPSHERGDIVARQISIAQQHFTYQNAKALHLSSIKPL